MRLSWNEIRARAAEFAEDWKSSGYERGHTQTFYNEFFEIFGLKKSRVYSFEQPVKKLGEKRGFIDLFWKGVLIVEQKSAGKNLIKAKEQALDYFPSLKEYELPRYKGGKNLATRYEGPGCEAFLEYYEDRTKST